MQNLLQIGLFKVLTTLPKFRTLGSSHSWSCPPCCVPASSGDPTPTNTVTYTSDSPACISPLFNLATPLLMQQSHPTLALKPLIPLLPTLYPLPHPDLMLLAVSLHFLLPLPPDSLRVFQWNAGGLQSRSTELLCFILSHPIDLICIQESNLNSSSSFQIPGFAALRSDHTLSWSGILSPDATHTSSSIIIFVRQG